MNDLTDAMTAPGRAAKAAFWSLYPGSGPISEGIWEAVAQAAIATASQVRRQAQDEAS